MSPTEPVHKTMSNLSCSKPHANPVISERDLPVPLSIVLAAMEGLGVTPTRMISSTSIAELWQVFDSESHGIGLFKCLLPLWKDHPEIQQRFRGESEILKRVQGGAILPLVRESGDELPAWLLEGFSGCPLDQVLRQTPLLSPEQVIWIARQVVDGLCALGEIGFIHGDLRPEHVMIDRLGGVRLTGFYSATPIHFERKLPQESLLRELFSPPWYQPPELSEDGISAHPSQDLYQLGIILYQSLTGVIPFDGADRTEIHRGHRTSTPRPIRSIAPHVPRQVREFVDSLLFKSPLRRPQSLREVRKELFRLEVELLSLAAAG